MQLTNKLGLPEPLVRAILNDPYSRGDADISVTQLIDPPRKVALTEQFKDRIVEDASERIWALIGQIMHLILQRAGTQEVTEHTLTMMMHGWKIKGTTDLVPSGAIVDYKLTSAWSVKDGHKKEWEQQLNVLRLLCVANRIKADRLEIVCILRDWSKLEAKRNPDYPQAQVMLFNLPVWPIVDAEEWLSFAVLAHQAARSKLPDCTEEEMWAKPTTYALKKAGATKARRVLDSLSEAQLLAKDGEEIEIRPGERTRCEHYCAASEFCDQFKEYKNNPRQA